MKQIVKLTVFLLLVGFFQYCSNKTTLTNRVNLTKEVSVLMPQHIDKKEIKNKSTHHQAKIGSADIFVNALMDIDIETNDLNEVKNHIGINLDRYIEARKAKLLLSKDTITNNIVQCDFEYEIVDSENSTFGAGRFIVKDTDFISFIFQSTKPESKSDKALRKSFFNSIRVK